MSNAVQTRSSRRVFAGITVLLIIAVTGGVVLVAQAKREFAVSAKRYAFEISGSDRPEIRVRQDDLVQITFSAEDIPHSFTVDDYRINKRAVPGRSVTFEFRADKVGTKIIYCSLTNDERCRKETVGRLIVTPK